MRSQEACASQITTIVHACHILMLCVERSCGGVWRRLLVGDTLFAGGGGKSRQIPQAFLMQRLGMTFMRVSLYPKVRIYFLQL